MEWVRFYLDTARGLVDISYTDEDLPTGSNWFVMEKERAEKLFAEYIEKGFVNASNTPVYC